MLSHCEFRVLCASDSNCIDVNRAYCASKSVLLPKKSTVPLSYRRKLFRLCHICHLEQFMGGLYTMHSHKKEFHKNLCTNEGFITLLVAQNYYSAQISSIMCWTAARSEEDVDFYK